MKPGFVFAMVYTKILIFLMISLELILRDIIVRFNAIKPYFALIFKKIICQKLNLTKFRFTLLLITDRITIQYPLKLLFLSKFPNMNSLLFLRITKTQVLLK